MTEEIFTLLPFSNGNKKIQEHQGFTTSFWSYGQDGGTPLVLIHGFRGDHHGLEFLACALERYSNYHIIVPDLPGFGESYEETGKPYDLNLYCTWLASFIEHLNFGSYHLVGHSFGSIVTAHTIARQLIPPSTLSLINPICEPPLTGQNKIAAAGAQFYYWLGAQLPEKIGNPLLKAKIITRITSEFMAKTRTKNLRKFINRQHDLYFSTYNSRRALMQAYKVSTSHHVAEIASQLELPVLTIVGEKDDLGSIPAQQELAHTCRAHMVVVPNIGHLIHYEAPVTAASTIDSFIRENS